MTSGIKWDVFISHASKDKEKFVKPLVELLENNGVKVWYDDFSLKPGDSLLRSIDKGLSKSNYGVVVLSKAFMKKSWTEYELRGLVTREMAGRKVRIEIIHKIFHEELYPMPLEEVITNFRHDNDPLKEIQVWEKIAVAYLSLTANRKLDLEQKREIFSALLGSSMGSLTEQDFSEFKYVTPEMINNELKRINSKFMYE